MRPNVDATTTYSPVRLFTAPMQAVGIDANIRTDPIKIREPYLSQRDPKTNLMTISKATAKMFVVHICCPSKSRSSAMRGRRGAIANQIKKATKKPHQLQWNALM